jgi:hypothetical protein
MAGNRSVARAEGRLSLVREKGSVRINFDMSLITLSPHLDPLALWQGGRRETPQASGRFQSYVAGRQTQYPVAGSIQNHFKLCDFALVTPATLLY